MTSMVLDCPTEAETTDVTHSQKSVLQSTTGVHKQRRLHAVTPRVQPGMTSAHLLRGEARKWETARCVPVASAPLGSGNRRQRNAVCRLGC